MKCQLSKANSFNDSSFNNLFNYITPTNENSKVLINPLVDIIHPKSEPGKKVYLTEFFISNLKKSETIQLEERIITSYHLKFETSNIINILNTDDENIESLIDLKNFRKKLIFEFEMPLNESFVMSCYFCNYKVSPFWWPYKISNDLPNGFHICHRCYMSKNT